MNISQIGGELVAMPNVMTRIRGAVEDRIVTMRLMCFSADYKEHEVNACILDQELGERFSARTGPGLEIGKGTKIRAHGYTMPVCGDQTMVLHRISIATKKADGSVAEVEI